MVKPFLGGGNLYDDDGALVVGQPFQFKNGIYSQLIATPSGAISAMYDGNTTTSYTTTSGATSERWFKWDFKRQIVFKNIYAYVATTYGIVTIQGSNNDTDWTTLSNSITEGGGGTTTGNCLASDKKYRYIRIHAAANGNPPMLKVYTIEGTV